MWYKGVLFDFSDASTHYFNTVPNNEYNEKIKYLFYFGILFKFFIQVQIRYGCVFLTATNRDPG